MIEIGIAIGLYIFAALSHKKNTARLNTIIAKINKDANKE